MSLWWWLLLACALGFAIKFAGYLLPQRMMDNPRMSRVAATLTIGLLASLTMVNAFSGGQALTLDARVVALGAAAVALWLRAPFLIVVIVGAVAAALTRLSGWG